MTPHNQYHTCHDKVLAVSRYIDRPWDGFVLRTSWMSDVWINDIQFFPNLAKVVQVRVQSIECDVLGKLKAGNRNMRMRQRKLVKHKLRGTRPVLDEAALIARYDTLMHWIVLKCMKLQENCGKHRRKQRRYGGNWGRLWRYPHLDGLDRGLVQVDGAHGLKVFPRIVNMNGPVLLLSAEIHSWVESKAKKMLTESSRQLQPKIKFTYQARSAKGSPIGCVHSHTLGW